MNVIVSSEPSVKKVRKQGSNWIVDKTNVIAVRMCSNKVKCLKFDVEEGLV